MRRRERFGRRLPWYRRLAARIAGAAAGASLPVLVLGGLAVAVPGVWLALPPPSLPADTLVYAKNGALLATLYGAENRIPVPHDAIPDVMRNAVVAIEDDRYYEEPDVDPVAILRAVVTDVSAGRILQGGSTITQQLAKNLYLSPERTIGRKLAELVITLKLGSRYSKAEILDMYLNDVYFGEGAWGVEAASQVYFGHSARTLTLPEAALLAGLVNAPSADDPLVHPQAARARRNEVLARMAALGYISPAAARLAQAAPLGLKPPGPVPNLAPYFVHYVEDTLSRASPRLAALLRTGGLRITTTLSLKAQRAADQAMATAMPPGTPVHGVVEPEGAVVGLDPATGAVLAMVGGRNYAASPFNRATRALRQPGSAFKYFVYTAAVAAGYPPSTVKVSAPVAFPDGHGGTYVPHNFGDVYNGPLTMRRAIALSDDIVALKWADTLGPARINALARSLGISTPLPDNLTTALGSGSVSPLNLAQALCPLANGGFRVTPYAVVRVTDADGRVIYRGSPHRVRVITPQVAYVVDQLFTAPLQAADGTAHDLTGVMWRPADAKTGTSSRQRDAWLAGFTPQLVGVVWVGNDDDTPIYMTGDQAAGPVWAQFMARALAGLPVARFSAPPHIVWRRICERTGLLANGCCTAYREVFIAGHVPTRVSPGCGSGGPNPAPGADDGPGGAGSPTDILRRILRALSP
ncbi:MAG: PBP1A family penicillin-binding protein [Actinomycetia bacterium]|nr:PBP1A family penicillin-binding protein [Actinomycetes bacterium]